MDPQRLLRASVAGLPDTLIDMHQILPSHPGMLEAQLLAMQRFSITKALLQSAPEQATSLCGNEKLREVRDHHPERFWPSHYVDPRAPEALASLSKLADARVRVVKLLPPSGFELDDPQFDDFLGAMEDLRLVAMVHTGFITARHKKEEARAGVFLSSTHGNPLTLDRPARKFPRLAIILCHLGGAIWHEEAGQMVTQHENVWGDVSGFGLFALRRLLGHDATVDWSKVFWGNDSVPFAYPLNLRLHLAALRASGAEALAPALLHENARRFADLFLA